PESDRPVVSRQGKEPATWIPRRAVEAERLLYMGKPFTALPPPDDRLARRSRGGEQLAAGVKRRPEDLAARVERGDFRAPAGGRVPFPDPRVAALTRAHDTAAVGGEGNALKGLAVSVEDRPGERNCKGELQRLRRLAPLCVVRITGLAAPHRDSGGSAGDDREDERGEDETRPQPTPPLRGGELAVVQVPCTPVEHCAGEHIVIDLVRVLA